MTEQTTQNKQLGTPITSYISAPKSIMCRKSICRKQS